MILETNEERQARIYPIILREYNPTWSEWYTEEKANLERLIGGSNIARISHFGSTSVLGLTAKPTVDILLEITENADIEKLIAALPDNEYICLRQQTMESPDLVMFLKGYTDTGFAEKIFHIHVRNLRDWDELYFRDYLIAHPEVAIEYAALKRELFKEHEHDRDGYTAAKGEFIKTHTKRAKAEAKNSLLENSTKSIPPQRARNALNATSTSKPMMLSHGAKVRVMCVNPIMIVCPNFYFNRFTFPKERNGRREILSMTRKLSFISKNLEQRKAI